ncbi:MAG: sugar transferase [Bacteroidales bacterium]|nr:sugar transferase [Bacteroidales bacterium]
MKRLSYIVWDAVAAMSAWAAFFLFRKVSIENNRFEDVNLVFQDSNFWWGILLLPVAWCLLYAMQGTYTDVLRKSRLKELQQTFWASFIGVIVIFFALLLDDNIKSYKNYYVSFMMLFLLHFGLTYIGRLCLTSRTARLVHTRRIGFPTLLVGGGAKALATYRDLDSQAVYSGNLFVGFVSYCDESNDELARLMPHLGKLDDIGGLIEKYAVEEVIIAIDGDDDKKINSVIRLLDRRDDVIIKITPDLRDIVYGSVKLSSIFHSPLITFNPRPMEEWQYSVKRLSDIVLSLLALLLLSPVFLVTAIIVKCTSPGPVFYAQERIGHRGRPFMMHKFRSMYVDAEQSGPALSKDDDPRITPFGRIMRKYRLDEIPQFYNVLKGTMSIVGPRPERQYYIDKIVERTPEYLLLQKVKPGITSWGQVKYGYAENVDEMVERLRYDLLYLENMSLTTDIKILLYTVIIIFQGRGK